MGRGYRFFNKGSLSPRSGGMGPILSCGGLALPAHDGSPLPGQLLCIDRYGFVYVKFFGERKNM